jgi:CRP-like cAMP-binding protein
VIHASPSGNGDDVADASDGDGNGTGNRILDALPRDEYEALTERLELVRLETKDQLYRRGEPIEFVHFPVDCVLSMLSEMEDGRAVEVATVGNEGMGGLPVFLQAAYTSAHESLAQIPGSSWRMPADAFTRFATNGGKLQVLLQRYTQALFSLVAQNSACNRLHTVDQRCARWLLLTHDRVKGDEFPLTQEFLAQMLGVQRTSVNSAAAALQERGLIRYSRGVISILDRAGLEDVSCECYRVVDDEFRRLIP